ncbi:MAG: tail protein X [bacterium]|nr:tail protein X [bacterium]
MSIYVTNTGDTFDSIAYSKLGSEEFMTEIIKANLQFAGIIRFGFGTELEIPDIDKVPNTTALPSWRRT